MTKTGIALLSTVLFVIPLAVSAQTTGTQPPPPPPTQTGTSSTSTTATSTPPTSSGGATTTCPTLPRPLEFGTHGIDVTKLQEFLHQQGDFSDEATGYFGPLTQAAVQRWQAHSGIVATGTPATTGWGVFGPLSRGWLERWCGEREHHDGNTFDNASTTRSCTAIDCAAGYHASGPVCSADRSCVPDATTTPLAAPVISGVDGPSSLSVGQRGTWTVHTASTAGRDLHYSVKWGDESVYVQLGFLSGTAPRTQSSATFTHAYATTGTFDPAFTVSNGAGSAQASESVTVSAGTSNASSTSSVGTGASSTDGTSGWSHDTSTSSDRSLTPLNTIIPSEHNTEPTPPPSAPRPSTREGSSGTEGSCVAPPDHKTYENGQSATYADWCPLGSDAIYCGSGTKTCVDGRWTTATGASASDSNANLANTLTSISGILMRLSQLLK